MFKFKFKCKIKILHLIKNYVKAAKYVNNSVLYILALTKK